MHPQQVKQHQRMAVRSQVPQQQQPEGWSSSTPTCEKGLICAKFPILLGVNTYSTQQQEGASFQVFTPTCCGMMG